ncbi:MAG: hypothetical protein Q4B26_00350 [Eubacteriales bacterium]|nr:hypothetical protein [Eubacteriales bacterium]
MAAEISLRELHRAHKISEVGRVMSLQRPEQENFMQQPYARSLAPREAVGSKGVRRRNLEHKDR